jgi:hypothetical protein
MSYPPPPNQPAWGQPSPEEPQPGQPFPPPFTQPQFGAPPQFEAPPQFAGGFPPPPPKKKSKVLALVLASVVAVLLLCVGGVVAVVVANKDEIQQAVDAAQPTATPTVTSTTNASPEPSAPPAITVKLVKPSKLGGRPRVTTKSIVKWSTRLEDAIAELTGASETMGGAWGNQGRSNLVMAAAAATPIDDPADELDFAMDEFMSGMKLKSETVIDPGPLGGEARCGTSGSGSKRMTVCMWADTGSLGMITWYFKSVSQVKGEFAKLRGQIEKVG